MRKRIVFLAVALMAVLAVNAKGFDKGYRGFVEISAGKYTGSGLMNGLDSEVLTVHGGQVTPNIFIGGGIGLDWTDRQEYGDIDGMAYNKREPMLDVPIFFDIRANFNQNNVSPYIDAKIGLYANNGNGVFAEGSFGLRAALKSGNGLYFGVGYKLREVDYETLTSVSYGSGLNYRSYWTYKDSNDKQNLNGFFFKVGFDF